MQAGALQTPEDMLRLVAELFRYARVSISFPELSDILMRQIATLTSNGYGLFALPTTARSQPKLGSEGMLMEHRSGDSSRKPARLNKVREKARKQSRGLKMLYLLGCGFKDRQKQNKGKKGREATCSLNQVSEELRKRFEKGKLEAGIPWRQGSLTRALKKLVEKLFGLKELAEFFVASAGEDIQLLKYSERGVSAEDLSENGWRAWELAKEFIEEEEGKLPPW